MAVLRRVPPGATLELAVLLEAKARLVARLLAVGVPRVVADERRRELREDARKRQRRPPSAARLALADWTILLLTNAPPELLSAEEAPVLMRARWQIERLLDLWKRHGCLEETRSGKPWRVLCEVCTPSSAGAGSAALGLLERLSLLGKSLPQLGEGGTHDQAEGARPG